MCFERPGYGYWTLAYGRRCSLSARVVGHSRGVPLVATDSRISATSVTRFFSSRTARAVSASGRLRSLTRKIISPRSPGPAFSTSQKRRGEALTVGTYACSSSLPPAPGSGWLVWVSAADHPIHVSPFHVRDLTASWPRPLVRWWPLWKAYVRQGLARPDSSADTRLPRPLRRSSGLVGGHLCVRPLSFRIPLRGAVSAVRGLTVARWASIREALAPGRIRAYLRNTSWVWLGPWTFVQRTWLRVLVRPTHRCRRCWGLQLAGDSPAVKRIADRIGDETWPSVQILTA